MDLIGLQKAASIGVETLHLALSRLTAPWAVFPSGTWEQSGVVSYHPAVPDRRVDRRSLYYSPFFSSRGAKIFLAPKYKSLVNHGLLTNGSNPTDG
jgi:hypothetical protein